VRLGQVNVDAMLRRITMQQFMEWAEYSTLEPFDEVRADYRAASIVQMIANMNRDIKKHPNPFSIEDFVLGFGDSGEARSRKKQTWQEQKLIAAQFAAMYAD
jgi:hypothetical protein